MRQLFAEQERKLDALACESCRAFDRKLDALAAHVGEHDHKLDALTTEVSADERGRDAILDGIRRELRRSGARSESR